jgi:hypothetical protein
MRYDRDAALSYARQYWLSPTSDGYVAGEIGNKPFVQVPDGTVFVHDGGPDAPEHALLPDGTVIPWKQLDDCTHFVSCVVGEPGGGLSLPRDFPSGPYGILGADRLVHAFLNRGYVEVIPVADKSDPGLERITPGDVIGYYRKSARSYAHLVIYAGDENIICHTYCRSDDPACTWDHRYTLGHDNDDWEWRLIRVKDD